MLWFYSRDQEALCVETRYDNQALEYVGILKYPSGEKEIHRFPTVKAFREWLLAVDRRLIDERWLQHGPPHILPDGWPDKPPAR